MKELSIGKSCFGLLETKVSKLNNFAIQFIVNRDGILDNNSNTSNGSENTIISSLEAGGFSIDIRSAGIIISIRVGSSYKEYTLITKEKFRELNLDEYVNMVIFSYQSTLGMYILSPANKILYYNTVTGSSSYGNHSYNSIGIGIDISSGTFPNNWSNNNYESKLVNMKFINFAIFESFSSIDELKEITKYNMKYSNKTSYIKAYLDFSNIVLGDDGYYRDVINNIRFKLIKGDFITSKFDFNIVQLSNSIITINGNTKKVELDYDALLISSQLSVFGDNFKHRVYKNETSELLHEINLQVEPTTKSLEFSFEIE